jgi:hypothetical protein
MKLVVSFYGMCLCVLDKRKGGSAKGATVLLLNGAAPPTARRAQVRPQLPYHHPLLFVPAQHADVPRSTWLPLPTPDTLVDTERLFTGRHVGWNLAGLDLTLGRGRGLTLHQRYDDADLRNGRLPPPRGTGDTDAYLDWRRIPDLKGIAPRARLRPAFTKIGANVLGIVRIGGGELRGAVPKNLHGNGAAWRFSDTYEQVITDRFEFHTELPGSDLVAAGFAGGRQSIRIKGAGSKTVRLSIVHEATPSDVTLYSTARRAMARAAGPDPDDELPHYLAFYDAIQGQGVDTLAPPRRGARPNGPSIDTPDCPPALI